MNAAILPAAEASKETSSHGAVSRSIVAMGEHAHLRGGDPCIGISGRGGNPSADGASHSALSECVTRTIRRYLADIRDTLCDEGLHALVIREVEGPLLREVLAFHDGNQSRAASVLGINRATLRKKLAAHGLL